MLHSAEAAAAANILVPGFTGHDPLKPAAPNGATVPPSHGPIQGVKPRATSKA